MQQVHVQHDEHVPAQTKADVWKMHHVKWKNLFSLNIKPESNKNKTCVLLECVWKPAYGSTLSGSEEDLMWFLFQCQSEYQKSYGSSRSRSASPQRCDPSAGLRSDVMGKNLQENVPC